MPALIQADVEYTCCKSRGKMSITSFRTTYMSNRTEDVANKGKIADLVVKFMDFDMPVQIDA